MMKVEKSSIEENVLSYLSETLNNCLTLSEFIKDKKKSDNDKIHVSMSELFSLYQSAKLYYFMTCQNTKNIDILNFFTTFDEFYFELKHYYLYENHAFSRDFTPVQKHQDELVELFGQIFDKLS